VREHDIGFDRLDLFNQSFAEAFPQFFILGKLRHHSNLPLGCFTNFFAKGATPSKET
jgi:hypothetical protein